MARSMKKVEARLRELEAWRELMDTERLERIEVVGFVYEPEVEDDDE